jgi:uncharacterized DUF497 family protein
MSKRSDFEWDFKKDKQNQGKHGVSFALAQLAFLDPGRVILEDLEHSENEKRFYCLGRVSEGGPVCEAEVTVLLIEMDGTLTPDNTGGTYKK